MTLAAILQAILLGVVEGLTEFIPVSSTGHILLLGEVIGFESAGNTFEVLIQLGAILAIVTVYFERLWTIARTLPTRRETQTFVLGVGLAFLPAALAGVLLHDTIKTVFFESPALICWMLLIGGVLLLLVDRYAPSRAIATPTSIRCRSTSRSDSSSASRSCLASRALAPPSRARS